MIFINFYTKNSIAQSYFRKGLNRIIKLLFNYKFA